MKTVKITITLPHIILMAEDRPIDEKLATWVLNDLNDYDMEHGSIANLITYKEVADDTDK